MATLDETLLGRDLEVPIDPTAALPITPTGDVRLVVGRPNLRAALRRRVLTSAGELVHRPEYGCGAAEFVEELSSPATRAELANAVRRNLLRDDRLGDVAVAASLADPTTAPDAVLVELTLQLRRDLGEEQLTVLEQG